MKTKQKTRPIADQDREFLKSLFESTRKKELNSVHWSREQRALFVEQQFHAQHTHYMNSYTNATFDIIELEDKPIGRLYVDRSSEDIRIIDISLMPRYRNRGIGSTYLKELFDESRESGLPVTIHVEKNNPARSLYERMGFEIKEDRGVYLFLERPVELELRIS